MENPGRDAQGCQYLWICWLCFRLFVYDVRGSGCGVFVKPVTLAAVHSSIINIPGESTLRRDFLRLQLANKERSEALRRQQLEQQQNDEHKRQLLAERQKRIEEQKEQRRRLEEVRRKKRVDAEM